MTSSSNTALLPAEFTGVTMMARHYLPIHVQPGMIKFISDSPKIDLKVAQEAARAFAEQKKIYCEKDLLSLTRPILTVVEQDQKWYPAELRATDIRVWNAVGSRHLGEVIDLSGSQEDVIRLTRQIAEDLKRDFLPHVGISLAKNKTA